MICLYKYRFFFSLGAYPPPPGMNSMYMAPPPPYPGPSGAGPSAPIDPGSTAPRTWTEPGMPGKNLDCFCLELGQLHCAPRFYFLGFK